jgi:hypothetical protein
VSNGATQTDSLGPVEGTSQGRAITAHPTLAETLDPSLSTEAGKRAAAEKTTEMSTQNNASPYSKAVPLRRLPWRVPRADLRAASFEPLRLEPDQRTDALAEIHSRWPILHCVPSQACAHSYGQRTGSFRPRCFSPWLAAFLSLCTRFCASPRLSSATASTPHSQPGVEAVAVPLRPSGPRRARRVRARFWRGRGVRAGRVRLGAMDSHAPSNTWESVHETARSEVCPV